MKKKKKKCDVNLRFLSRKMTRSEYDWANINQGETMVGKIRMTISGKKATVYSINIFPEFERQGFAACVIELLKKEYERITADRVRPTARIFWEKVGFIRKDCDTFV